MKGEKILLVLFGPKVMPWRKENLQLCFDLNRFDVRVKQQAKVQGAERRPCKSSTAPAGRAITVSDLSPRWTTELRDDELKNGTENCPAVETVTGMKTHERRDELTREPSKNNKDVCDWVLGLSHLLRSFSTKLLRLHLRRPVILQDHPPPPTKKVQREK